MIRLIDIQEATTLEDYAGHLHLAQRVRELQKTARAVAPGLRGRTVWMINSTATGGGVAEMLPKLVAMLRELGVRTEWVVVGAEDERFFHLTKRIHNLLHGAGDPRLGAADRAVYERVSRDAAAALRQRIRPGDVLVVHDPQPLGVGALLKRDLDLHAVWRCHIGLDRETPQTKAAWDFLMPWARAYDATVFSLPDYVPAELADDASIIHPAIDPLSDKNRELSVRRVAGILHNAEIEGSEHPVVTSPFESPALRLQPDGTFAPASRPESIGLFYRPVVTQVSRWDRLKGFAPLLQGFVRLKTGLRVGRVLSERHRRRLELVRLVLAGPDPTGVHDDPEGQAVFEELRQRWLGLPAAVQRDVAVLVLPMGSRRDNALMVNALQRCTSIAVQNSLREGFGLTVTEAMWKRVPVLGSSAAGIRSQVRDEVDGRLVDDPEDPEAIARVLDAMLENPARRVEWAQNAQQRVAEHYLVFSQAQRWLEVLGGVTRQALQAA